MAKYPVLVQKNAKSFTRWIRPCMLDFKFACCACGLVHDIKFRIVDRGNCTVKGGHVEFKLRRNKKETKKQQKRMCK